MAFNATNLVYSTFWQYGPDNIGRMWEYDAGSDNIAAVEDTWAGGYFVAAAKIFRKGEPVRVTASDGKALYVISGVNPDPGGPQVNLKKLAAGVTSFPT